MPSSPEITTPSKSSVEQLVRVAVHAPRVRHERRADPGLARAARTASTIAASGCTPANSPSISPSGSTSSSGREAPLERGLVELALLQRDQQLAERGIGAEAPAQRLRVDLRPARSSRERTRTGCSSARRPSRSAGRCAPSPSSGIARPLFVAYRSPPYATASAWRASSSTPSPNVLQVRVVGGRRRRRACSCPP